MSTVSAEDSSKSLSDPMLMRVLSKRAMENLCGGSLEIFNMTIHCKVSARQVYCMLERGLPSNREASAWHDNTEGMLVQDSSLPDLGGTDNITKPPKLQHTG